MEKKRHVFRFPVAEIPHRTIRQGQQTSPLAHVLKFLNYNLVFPDKLL